MKFVIDGHEVLFDEEDLLKLFNFKWRVYKRGNTHYVESGSHQIDGRWVHGMHHIVMGRKDGFVVDHINGSGLDNRKANLRFATLSENQCNQRPREGRKYRGVYWHNGKWRAVFQKNKKQIHVGYFDTQEEAALAYNKSVIEHHGEFATLNEVSRAL